MINTFLKYCSLVIAVLAGLYVVLLGLLTTPSFQSHVVYLHKLQFTWFKDLDVPETFGFLYNQVTPFAINSSDGTELYSWHILPIELYRQHEAELTAEPASFASNFTSRGAFQFLRDDPEARLVIHMHGAAGTVASRQRIPNYRALSAGQPSKIHVLAFDYRGFGRSRGTPSEQAIILDAISVANWAMEVAGISPSRIIIFGQSLGTAVSLAVSEHFALQRPPVVFAGTVLVAPFVDIATLVTTYSIGKYIPLLSPIAKIPPLFHYFKTFIRDQWSSKDRIAAYIRANNANKKQYRLHLIHAEDDHDIPWTHTPALFWHAVNATIPTGIRRSGFEKHKKELKRNTGAAGSVVEWQTEHGLIREEILKYGLHDVLMGYPAVTMAVMRIFEAVDPSFP